MDKHPSRVIRFLRNLVPVVVVAIALMVLHTLLLGYPFPMAKIDRLHAAQSATLRAGEAVLADRTVVKIPHLSAKSAEHEMLVKATRNGIEVTADGRAFVLLEIVHWCGTDPVRWHWERVDLDIVAEYFLMGEVQGPPYYSEGYDRMERLRGSAWRNPPQEKQKLVVGDLLSYEDIAEHRENRQVRI